MKKKSIPCFSFLIVLVVIFLSNDVNSQITPIELKYDFPHPEIIKNVFGGKTNYEKAIQELEQELYNMEKSA